MSGLHWGILLYRFGPAPAFAKLNRRERDGGGAVGQCNLGARSPRYFDGEKKKKIGKIGAGKKLSPQLAGEEK